MTEQPHLEGDIVTPEWLEKHGVRIDPKTYELLSDGHAVVKIDGRGHVRAARSVVESQLDWLLVHHNIDAEQHEAGLRYYRLWYFGCVKSHFVQSRYADTAGGEADPAFLARMADLYRRASKSIRSVAAKQAVYRVCCLSEPASHSLLRRRRTHAMAALRKGLDDLARHFRL